MTDATESLSLSTSQTDYQPYVVTIVIKKGKNLPVGDVSSSDPYVVLKIGSRIVGRTPMVRFSLSPVWNYTAMIPLLHLSCPLVLEIWDHDDIGEHDFMGQFEVDLGSLPTSDTAVDMESSLEQAPNSAIKPRGTVCYSIQIKFRETLISVKAGQRQPVALPLRIEQLADAEFSVQATPVTIQQALKESGIFTSKAFSWTKLRDILTDVDSMITHVAHDHDGSVADPHNPLLPTLAAAGAASGVGTPGVASKPSRVFYRIEANTVFSRALRMHLNSNTCEEMPPQLRHSFILETKQHSYTLVAPNVFMMWLWVKTIRRNFMAYHMIKEGRMDESAVGVGSLYQSYHLPHVEGPDLEGSVSGTLSVQLNGELYDCRCSISGLVMECIDLTHEAKESISLNLHGLKSIVISQEYGESLEYELATNLESGRVSVNALNDAQKIARNSGVIDTGPNSADLNRPDSKWYVGKAVVKGVQLTGKIVTGVVKGTVHGTTMVVKGTAGLATSAATGIVSVAASGLGVVQEEIATVPVLQVPRAGAIVADAVSGIAPYWDKHCVIPMDKYMIGEEIDDSDDGDLRPVGILAHMVGVRDRIETVVGSKFLRYEDLLPDDPHHMVVDDNLQERGGLASEIVEISFHMDEDVEFMVEIHSGENLLPPPSSESLNTLITHPLQTFVNISTVAVATIGLTSHTSQSQDRSPRVTGSLVKHNGRTIDKTKKQRTRVMSKTLNPVWNQAFVFTVADGLHYADMVKLVIQDESRSGPDAIMGAVYIPKDLFLSKRVTSVVPYHEMSVAAARFRQGLGYLDVTLRMRVRKLESAGHIGKADVAPKMNITAQLRPSNEVTTAYICDCLSKSAMAHLQPNSIERYHITPSCDGLVLETLEERAPLFNAVGGNDKQHQMLLHQFLTKEVETVPAGWDGTPPKMVERYIYHVYQNERRSLALEWGGQYLIPTDRREFTDESGTVVSPFSPLDTGLDPPAGFRWDDSCARQWVIDHDYTKVDTEGWCYGADFGYIMNNYRNGSSVTTAGLRPTRRRRWKRVAYRVTEFPADPTSERVESAVVSPRRDTSGFDDDDHPAEEITVVIFENQRHAIYWGKHLIPRCERGPYSDDAGKNYDIDSLETAPPPAGYEWLPDSDWEIDAEYVPTDEAGWIYAFDFLAMTRDLKAGKNLSNKTGTFVRRRKWRRRALKVRKTIGEFARGKTVSNVLNEDSCVARRAVSHMTKEEAFALHRDDILLLCQERADLKSAITIPWEQVSRVDIVTPSVVMIGTTVNRYFGENQHGVEQFRPAEIEICVLDCHADKLCVLLRERIRVREYRQYVRCLLASGTMTGEIGVCDYYSAGDGAVADDVLMSDQDLSLGSQTILNLEDEVAEIDAQIKSVNRLAGTNADAVTRKWAKSETTHLTSTKMRLKIYAAALMGAGLMGPKFEEEDVKAALRRDVAEAERVFRRANSHGDSVGAAEEMVNNLLLTAEMRIRDTALCGWSHQGPVLEKCLSIIINGYYISIIGVLGKFFDSREGLMQLKGNESKLKLIRCIMENDTHLSNIIFSSLRPYSFLVEPAPLLSLSLDVKALVQWYAEALEAEIKIYMHNVFTANLKVRERVDEEYKLPWEIVQDGTLWISLIPRDAIAVMTNFINLVSMAGSSPFPSRAMEAFVQFLEEKIRMTHVECFVFLIQRYQEVLTSHDWTEPVPCKGVIYSADDAFDAVGSHIYWLASIANDCTLILSRHVNACVKSSDGVSTAVEMSPENMEQMAQKMYRLTKLLSSTIACAMDSLTCIVYKSYSEIMPTRNIFESWTHCGGKTPELVKTIIREEASYVKEVLGDTMEQSCQEKFRELSLRKLCVWYLCLIRDSAASGATLSAVDAALMIDDNRTIKEFFMARSQGGSSSHRSQVEQELTLLEDVTNIMTHSFGGREFSGSMYSLIEDATSEKYRASSLKAMVKALFKFRGAYTEQMDESFLGVDVAKLQKEFLGQFDVIVKESGGGVTVPKCYQLEPLPDMLVFGQNVNLGEYLQRSATERSKVLKRIDKKETSRAQAEEVKQRQAKTAPHSSHSHEHGNRRGSIMNWFSSMTANIETPRLEGHAKSATSEVSGIRRGQNIVEVRGLSVDSLFCLDTFSNLAVYVEFMIEGKKTYTTVKKNTLSPTWAEIFSLTVSVSNVECLSVLCTVYYQMKFRRDIRVGVVSIPIESLWGESGMMEVQQQHLDCSNSSAEIHEAIKSEDRGRMPPSLSLKLSLGIKKK